MKHSFAIIGGGPAGFYMAKLLSKHPLKPIVHIYQKQLTPFGLLRYGVAPDHIPIKKAQNTLAQAAQYQNFSYFGNTIIQESNYQELRKRYSGIVYAYGASRNNELGFQDYVARDFVHWYNSYPNTKPVQLDEKMENLTIVGNGNVAIDITRIILKDPEKLKKTDINLHALQAIKKSKVRNISVVGRRGVVQSAFTLKEIREIKGEGIEIYLLKEQLQQSLNQESRQETVLENNTHHLNLVRANKRKLQFLSKNSIICETSKDLEDIYRKDSKKLILRYLLNPLSKTNNFSIFNRTTLSGHPFKQSAQIVEPQQQIIIPSDLLISSMGFKSQSILNNKYFNQRKAILENIDGVVVNRETNKLEVGVYAVGWIKTGAVGVIDTTLLNCEQTYNNLRIHMEEGMLEMKEHPKPLVGENQLSFDDYLKVKQEEMRLGKQQQRDRVKLTNQQILQFLNKE